MGKKIVLFGEAEEAKSEEKKEPETAKVLIEDIYLIHRGSGKLIQRKTWRVEGETDPDMVAGMFEAVLNFITDSFARGTETNFSRFDIKGYTVLLCSGKIVHLAIVLSMAEDYLMPEETLARLRTLMDTCVAEIEERYSGILKDWCGEIESVKETRNLLEELSINMNNTLSERGKKIEIGDRIFQEAIFELQRKADLALKKRKYSSALSMLNKSISMGYAPPEILFKKARVLFHCRKYGEALEVLSTVEPSMGKGMDFCLLKAKLLQKLGKKDEAMAVLDAFLASAPGEKKVLKLRNEIAGE
ncbi:MAG: CDC27 family protein [Thermoplasmata archaeon]